MSQAVIRAIQNQGGGSQPDYGAQVVEGDIPGVVYVRKFGSVSDVDISTAPEDVWGPGGELYVPWYKRLFG